MDPKEVVLSFWEAMRSNDFYAASEFLSEDFKGFWPQSSEFICGRDNFAAINTHYPASGRWEFFLHSILCEGLRVVTDVSVTDGNINGRVITFHTVVNGLICKQVEFWPDDFEAPEWRAQWVEIREREFW